jgi:hypothetical protein
MFCPICGIKTFVLETRYTGPKRSRKRRRHKCKNDECNYRLTTLEIEDGPLLREFLKGRLVPQSPRLQRRLDVERRDRLTAGKPKLLVHPLDR